MADQSTIPIPPLAAPGLPQAMAAPGPLDIRALLHPAEHSRLLIALSSCAVVFGVAAMIVYQAEGWAALPTYGAIFAAACALVWLSLQVFRSRLLGGAVRVSEATFPDLQSIFDEVRTRLNYHKQVDVYVMDKVDGGSSMTSYLGTRLILIEGGLVAELLCEERHAELVYLIGRHIGQLKARHQRLTLIMLAISMVHSTKFLQLFLAPYYRATVKSGDQIAAACCGDIRATAGMMNRLLVGKELGPRLVIKGVLDQATAVRRRWLPRLAQLFMNNPHSTNRYLNLLAFFARVAPEEIGAWRATLDEATANRLTAAIDASPNRRPPRRRMSLVSALLATLISGGLLAASGWVIFGVASGSTAAAAGVTGGNTSTGDPATTASQQLLSHIPPSIASTCKPIPVPPADASEGADAEVICQPAPLGGGGYVQYAHYRTPGAMQTAYANLTRGWPPSDCVSAAGQGSYPPGSSQPTGDLGCAVSNSGQHVIAWTDSRLAVLGITASTSMNLADLHQWWQSLSGPAPAPAGSAAKSPQPLTGITATLSTYFGAINARNYRLAWSQLSPADQSASPYAGFAAGQSTTTIQYWQLQGIAPGSLPGSYTASVTFRSYQNPSEAPNQSDSCDDWTLNYTMVESSGRWLINEANPQPGVPAYQSCG